MTEPSRNKWVKPLVFGVLAIAILQFYPYLLSVFNPEPMPPAIPGAKPVLAAKGLKYAVVFDISQESYQYWYLLWTDIGISILIVLLLILKKKWPSFFENKLKFVFTVVCFSFWIGVVLFSFTFAEYNRMRNALLNNTCEVAEGVVGHYYPRYKNGWPGETFTVGNRTFSDSCYVLGPEYHAPRAYDGSIKEGLKVRIHYVWGRSVPKIIKLEIQNN